MKDVFTSLLKLEAQKEIDKQGLQVFVKSSLTPSIKVFDSDKTTFSQGGGSSSFIDVGITIKNRNGDVIKNYGGEPGIDYFLAGSIVAFVLMIVFFFSRGVIK